MMSIMKSQDRGGANHGWLRSQHTFSFADYYNPSAMAFRALRVINEDWISGGQGFDTHPHRDMEIITVVLEGSLKHKDSMGNSTVILPGEVQRMSAGTGILHSEYNNETSKDTHLLQIWIMPQEYGIKPSYGQKSFVEDLKSKNLVLAVSKDGRDGSISMNQNADVYLGRLTANEEMTYSIKPDRHIWIQMTKGELSVNGKTLVTGDAIAMSGETHLAMRGAGEKAEFILFDLP